MDYYLKIYLIKKINNNLNFRGRGHILAFDYSERDLLVKELAEKDVIVLPCGSTSIRLRPTLDFSQKYFDKFITILKNTIFC